MSSKSRTDSSDAILPQKDVAATGSNLLLLTGFVVLMLWFYRLCRNIYRLYRLNSAVSTGQVVRLQTTDLGSEERAMLFGEMEMLWRTNLQQQLLRARHISTAIDVSELKVPFVIDKTSIKIEEDIPNDKLGIKFKYRASTKVVLQMFWHVSVTAMQDLLSQLNREHLGPGGRVATQGRKKKRFFGQRYISVNVRGNEADTGSRSFEMGSRTGGATSDMISRSQAPLFGDDQCCARSGVVPLSEDSENWVLFDNPEQGKVPYNMLADGTTIRTTPQLADSSSGEEPTGSASNGHGEREVRNRRNDESGSQQNEEPASPPHHTLVFVAKVLDFNAPSGTEKVSVVLVVAQETQLTSPRQGQPKSLQVQKQVVVTNKAAYVSQEIYGEEDENDEDCVICLCEPKDTTLLPCRHLCVCSSCFSRLEQCPVCRAPFTAYLKQNAKEEEPAEQVVRPDCAAGSALG